MKTIKYDSQGVVVEGIDHNTGESFQIDADLVVSTVSIGVLKNEHVKFVPQLPKRKQNAI